MRERWYFGGKKEESTVDDEDDNEEEGSLYDALETVLGRPGVITLIQMKALKIRNCPHKFKIRPEIISPKMNPCDPPFLADISGRPSASSIEGDNKGCQSGV